MDAGRTAGIANQFLILNLPPSSRNRPHWIRPVTAYNTGSRERRLILLLLMGLAAVAWAGYSLLTGKGYYKGCPPGGFDRNDDPFSYWAPTVIILAIGVVAILAYLGVTPLPARVERLN
jgi:hypothetical protein